MKVLVFPAGGVSNLSSSKHGWILRNIAFSSVICYYQHHWKKTQITYQMARALGWHGFLPQYWRMLHPAVAGPGHHSDLQAAWQRVRWVLQKANGKVNHRRRWLMIDVRRFVIDDWFLDDETEKCSHLAVSEGVFIKRVLTDFDSRFYLCIFLNMQASQSRLLFVDAYPFLSFIEEWPNAW